MIDSFISVFLLFVLGIVTLSLVLYYLLFFLKLSVYKVPQQYTTTPLPVSIIIAARNEYRNLEKNLKQILEQDYPEFEVVVINDCSWDESQKLLEYYQEVYTNLKICKLVEQEKYPTGKKFALTIGIKAAKYNNLLFTDADCMPAGKDWLKHMASSFSDNHQIILGHSPIIAKTGLLNLFIRFENALTAMFYFAAAIHKNPFMGVGRNLAYTKDVFFMHKGFASHQHILSGDDDLFVNKAANLNNTAIQLNPNSFVYTEPKTTFEAYSRQKSRHISTGKYYKNKHKLLLGGYYIPLIIFYIAFALLFFVQPNWVLPLYFLGIKFLVQTIVFTPALKKLGYKNLSWFLLLLDVLYFLYIVVFGTGGLLTRKPKQW